MFKLSIATIVMAMYVTPVYAFLTTANLTVHSGTENSYSLAEDRGELGGLLTVSSDPNQSEFISPIGTIYFQGDTTGNYSESGDALFESVVTSNFISGITCSAPNIGSCSITATLAVRICINGLFDNLADTTAESPRLLVDAGAGSSDDVDVLLVSLSSDWSDIALYGCYIQELNPNDKLGFVAGNHEDRLRDIDDATPLQLSIEILNIVFD